MNSRVIVGFTEFLIDRSQRVKVRRHYSEKVSDNSCTSRERCGPTFVPSLHKQYLEGH